MAHLAGKTPRQDKTRSASAKAHSMARRDARRTKQAVAETDGCWPRGYVMVSNGTGKGSK